MHLQNVSRTLLAGVRAARAQGCHLNRSIATTSINLSNTPDSGFRESEDLAKERYDTRANEDLETKRARLKYQSRKRGMLENGVILATFAEKHLHKFDAEHLDQYDRLINLPTNDWDIFYWAIKTKPTPPEFETSVMRLLREHINSKVSIPSDLKPPESQYILDRDKPKPKFDGESLQRGSMLDRLREDDIVAHPESKKYNLKVDINEVDPTNVEELHDSRLKKVGKKEYIQMMTDWRLKQFQEQRQRALSQPFSVSAMTEAKHQEVYTHRNKHNEMDVAKKSSNDLRNDLLDSDHERVMKHHHFMQYLLSSRFTDDVQDYDDETKAWAEMIWHRNYGGADLSVAPSNIGCSSCSIPLQCCEQGLPGYVPREVFANMSASNHEKLRCQECEFRNTYDCNLKMNVEANEYIQLMEHMRKSEPAIICLVLDITNIPSGAWLSMKNLYGQQHKYVIALNKIDLLPKDCENFVERVSNRCIEVLRSNNVLQDMHTGKGFVMPISARTGFGLEALVTVLQSLNEDYLRDVYLVGSSNSGRSTLFSALLQTDMARHRDRDIICRIARYDLGDPKKKNRAKLLRFPLDPIEGWQIALKRRRLAIELQRKQRFHDMWLGSTSQNRQADMPHMSLLIDRFTYPHIEDVGPADVGVDDIAISDTKSSLVTARRTKTEEPLPNLCDDHPLKYTKPVAPMLAEQSSREELNRQIPVNYLHYTPSFNHPDHIDDLLTFDEKLLVHPNETLYPRKYTLRPLQSILISGLARLDLLTASESVIMTVIASKYLPVHVLPTHKTDQFYDDFLGTPYLGVPFGPPTRLKRWPGLSNSPTDVNEQSPEQHPDTDKYIIDSIRPLEQRLNPEICVQGCGWREGAADIVLSSIGWIMINLRYDQACVVQAHTPQGRGIHVRQPCLLGAASRVRGMRERYTPYFHNSRYRIEKMTLKNSN